MASFDPSILDDSTGDVDELPWPEDEIVYNEFETLPCGDQQLTVSYSEQVDERPDESRQILVQLDPHVNPLVLSRFWKHCQ